MYATFYAIDDLTQNLNSTSHQTTNLKNAATKLIEIQEDIDFLRDNVITTEVNIARTYNYDVRRRKAELEANALVEAK